MNIDYLRYLQTSLSRIDELIRVAVVRAQNAGHDPTDALRGLVISDDEIEEHLTRPAMASSWKDDTDFQLPELILDKTNDLPFLHLVRIFQLNTLDCFILLLCLAPEFDRRYERLYAFLQDDVSARRATVNLIMNVLGIDVPQRFAVWDRLAAHQPLRYHHLINSLPDPGQYKSSFLSHYLKVDHRLTAYLLGSNEPDERLEQTVRIVTNAGLVGISAEDVEPIRQVLSQSPVVFMHGRPDIGQAETAAALCSDYDLPLVRIKLAELTELELDFTLAWKLALREAYLLNGAVLFDEWKYCLNEAGDVPIELWEAIQAFPHPVFISSADDWEPVDTGRQRRMLRLKFAIPSFPERRDTWIGMVNAYGLQMNGNQIDELANKFRFSQGQIVRAVHTAADIATSRGKTMDISDLYSGAQAHASLKLGQLAKKIEPRYEWQDLILPPEQLKQLHEITDRARFSYVVQEQWGFGEKVAPVAGVSALFAGESGTGKTLAAEVIAKNLGLVLYKIDLSAVVSKYIGETEKNLSIIFTEAQASNAILFFDEADALFGKRSEVKDARDRYANIEIAYLLQQIESYDGVSIMATNLRQNLDEAFTRRLDFLVDFPFPESEYRLLIWQAHFPKNAPLAEDVDLNLVAEQYRLAGGNIRNAAVASAYLAAADSSPITLPHIRGAVRREHQKMGRLLEEDY